jgi:hypothetical protein
MKLSRKYPSRPVGTLPLALLSLWQESIHPLRH